MLVFTAVFLIASVLESLKAETRQFGERALADRLFIKTSPAGAELMPQLRAAEPEFANLLPLNAEVTSSFLIRGIESRQLGVGSLARRHREREAFESERTIILSTRCADDLGKQPGDLVRLATRSSGLLDFEILAVTDEYGFAPDDRVFGVVSADNMLNYWCIESAGLGDHFVAWSPGLDAARVDELRAAAVAVLSEDNVLEFRRGEEITAAYVADLDRNFAMFYAILVLTILLAAVGILNAMVIAVMERRREIGLLRAVGLTGRQVAGMLLLESGSLGALGGLLGLALGIPLAIVTARALTAVSHLDIVFVLSPRALGAVLGGAVLIALLAVLMPALRANRMSLSEVMRYE
jgi:ABC-type lipoprotein release transport system permease subunit